MELKIPPVVQVLVAGVAMWIMNYLFPFTNASVPNMALLAVVFYLSGIIAALSGVYAFRQANTTVDPRTPNKTSALVVFGIYKFTRNPMYLGFALLLTGFGLSLANPFTLPVIVVFVWYMNRYQILPEERSMQQKFGETYASYTHKVRRWI